MMLFHFVRANPGDGPTRVQWGRGAPAGRRAVTLLEILIAAVIVALAFLPVLRVVGFGGISTQKTNATSRATRLVQELIEEVKHVPFSVYQREVPNLDQGTPVPIPAKFYEKTAKSIADFKNTDKNIKDFSHTATLTGSKNSVGQVVEIWFEVEIKWQERGASADVGQESRKVRAGNSLFNPEAVQ